MDKTTNFPTEYEMTLARLYAALRPEPKLSKGGEQKSSVRNQSIETFLFELRHLMEESKTSVPRAA